MEKRKFLILGITIAAVVCVSTVAFYFAYALPYGTPTEPATRMVTDMTGRSIEVPVELNRVVGTYPPQTILVFSLSPEKLVAWNYKLKPTEAAYMDPKYCELPDIGGWFGGHKGNYETFMSISADVIIESTSMYQSDKKSTELANEITKNCGGVPVVIMHDYIDRYDETLAFMGDLLGKEEKAAELTAYYEKIMTTIPPRVAQIPESERVKVYYAEGPDGLKTDPKGSRHTRVLDIAGGVNVAEHPIKTGYGRIGVSLEQIVVWDPDVIITSSGGFYKKVFDDPKWQVLRAVRDKRVYLIPYGPFGWFDRPPGINRIIGIPWLAKTLYPEEFKDIDLESEMNEFYSKFYHYELSDADIQNLLARSR